MKRCDVGNNKWAHEERDRHQNTRNRGGGKAEGKKDPPFCGKSGKTIWRKRHLPKRCAKLKQIGAVRLLMLKAKPIRVGLPLRLHWLPRMAIPAVLQAPGNRNRHVFIFVHPKSYNKEPHTRQHVQTTSGCSDPGARILAAPHEADAALLVAWMLDNRHVWQDIGDDLVAVMKYVEISI